VKEKKGMNLKECYRYANYLERITSEAKSYIINKEFVTTTKETHLRSKANSDAQDEVILTKKPVDVDFTTNDIINLIVELTNEKEKLAAAIAEAKSKTEINIDNAISLNKKKQDFIHILNGLSNVKSTEKQRTGTDYKFNQEGNQTTYYYTISEETSIDFDRNMVRSLIKKYSKECDEVSAKLDEIEINTKVNFEPKFDVNTTSIADVIAEYL
jgi:hypothetical protein